MRIKVQGWDVTVGEEVVMIDIERTNLSEIQTSWDKVKKYRTLIADGSDYPAVILEHVKNHVYDYYKIIDGAHRIKAVKTGLVKARLVVNHNN